MIPRFYSERGAIYLRVYPRPRQVCKFYLRISTDHWSSKKQTVLSKDKQYAELNKYIEEVKTFTTNTIINSKIGREPISSTELKELLQKTFIGKVADKEIEYSYTSFIDYFVNSKSVAKDTKDAYRTGLRRALKFYPKLSWNDITLKWRIESEIVFLQNYTKNTVNKTYEHMRDMLTMAVELGICNVTAHTSKLWYSKTESVDNIFLTRAQIDQLYNFDYARQKHRNAVDLFVLGCETGQRYSDFSRISKSMIIHIGNDSLIRLETKKSGNKKVMVSIPTNDRIFEILERFRKISDQNLRDYIKEAAFIVGLKDYNRIGTHTARRSYATNNVIDGIPNHLTMSVGGWKTEKQFLSYVKYTDVMTAMDLISFNKAK
jgi:site-specific recombinase XerD